jgi:CRISPR-associated endonuclease/helicase Cas3
MGESRMTEAFATSGSDNVPDLRADKKYAHTAPIPGAPWQPLEEHLENVAELAAEFAAAFGSEEWGRIAGSWHDIGKYSEAFQQYLRMAGDPDVHSADHLPRTDHSTAGARHAAQRFGRLGQLLSYVIAGHHAGLPDADGPGGSSLRGRLRKDVEPWHGAPSALTDLPEPELPPFLLDHLGNPTRKESGFGVALFTRMLFSVLVDADFLDTEAFMSPERTRQRARWPDDVIARMLRALDHYYESFPPPSTEVNRRRAEVADACGRAAERSPGLFTLTVPTGGGKTLASLLFALRHADRHGLRRVIYVAPFTSIIEQNAEVYREVLRPLVEEGLADPVVEHHSNFDPAKETDQSRRASENWDAPLVVTTAVQFYESLFANRSSRCRKLHNLVRAVIVLDEAQSLPVNYLAPCLRVLEALVRDYGSTIVLCTATQPAIRRSDALQVGIDLSDHAEIVPDPPALFSALKRVEVDYVGPLADEEVVRQVEGHEQVLCIVNTRKHARVLAQSLGRGDGHFHLSALMCPAHRAEILADIRRRLNDGERCRVVSTQLVEAGVDVDFPSVYRALAGLDSIAQAAGRCNRNGRAPRGVTTVFETEHVASERFISDQVGSARQMLELHDDLLAPEAVEHYFRVHYWEQKHRWDRQGVLDCFGLDNGGGDLPFLFQFRTAAESFRLIETAGLPVIIPWREEGRTLCQELRQARHGPNTHLLRRLQRYTVQIPERVWQAERARAFEMVDDQYAILALSDARYSDYFGLHLEADVGTAFVV